MARSLIGNEGIICGGGAGRAPFSIGAPGVSRWSMGRPQPRSISGGKARKRQRFVLMVALLAIFTGSRAQAQPSNAPPVSIRDSINARFQQFMESAHVPGLVWGVVQNGRLAYVGALGAQDIDTRHPVTADSGFRIASMSKAFTALAILHLRDEGKISLDAPLDRYVPEARSWHYPTSDSPKVRIRDLLGHTGGFGPDDPWSDRQQPLSEKAFTALLAKGFSFNHDPQTRYEYSSLGYALLGRVITNVSGSRYDRYIERTFLRPLGMNASGYEIADVPADRLAVGYRWENDKFVQEPSMPNGAFGAMGGVHTTANDYARWVAFLLSAWPARDGAETGPAKRATVRELAIGTSFPRLGGRPRSGNVGPCSFAAVYAAGFTTVRDCDLGTVLTHNGGYPGYGSTVLLMPEVGTAVFAFTNRTYAAPVGVVFDTAQALKDAGLLKTPVRTPSEALGRAYARVGTMYHAGDVGQDELSANVLMDRSAANWRQEFGRLKKAVGDCTADEAITVVGRLSGEFTWRCEHGSIRGTLELSPTSPPLIQTLTFKEMPQG